MKKISLLFWLLLIQAMFCRNALAAERVESVVIMDFYAADGNLAGKIQQSEFALSTNDTVRIDMSQVYAMYPEHTGIYGVMYTDGTVTITAPGQQPVSGQNVIEFSFPGAESCEVSGQGNVYAYFLPVPYLSVSTDVSLVNQHFDTRYLTKTASGHYNMFMLTNPHVFTFQHPIPPYDTVYKDHSVLGPLPQEYQYLLPDGMSGAIFCSFMSERPVLLQCRSIYRESYDTNVYTSRPMVKVIDKSAYEIWCYQDYQADLDSFYAKIDKVFETCIDVAQKQFLPPERNIDPIHFVILRDELSAYGIEGSATADELYTKIGFASFANLNTEAWENNPDHLTYLLAHEIGHLIQYYSLAYNTIHFSQWFSEGFATYFGEKVCEELGIARISDSMITQDDVFHLEKFLKNMVFNISDFVSYEAVGFDNEDVLMLPHQPYNFGCAFMYYLEEKYGEGFYKGISETFYQDWYKGHEHRFFYRRNEMNYNIDLFYALIKKGLDNRVYLDFPEYATEKFNLLMRQPDFILPAGIKTIGTEAFTGIAALRVQLPDGLETIGEKAFANCPNLLQITIPASVKTIADNAFNSDDLLIIGQAGSFAQTYAEHKGYRFESLQ